MALEVLGHDVAGHDGRSVPGGSGLPVVEGLVAGPPVPLPIDGVLVAPVREHHASGVVRVEAADREGILPVSVPIGVATVSDDERMVSVGAHRRERGPPNGT